MDGTGIAASALSFRYPDYPGLPGRPLLRGLDLRVTTGEIAVLLGASDEGKTTLARILGGLVPRFSGGTLSGAVAVAGADPTRTAPYDLLQDVGLVFQHPDEQVTSTRCDTEVAFALESLGVDRTLMRQRVAEALAIVGLESFAPRNPATLSGGEKKRLLLACLEAIDPRVWVLDEAFEELDPSWRRSTLARLRTRRRTALVLDSRWSPLFADAADRFGVLSRGAAGPLAASAADVSFNGAMEDAGLQPPGKRLAPARAGRPRPYLQARGLSFSFPEDGAFTLRIDGLLLETGSVTALVGENGSGKSTLARLLCGLLPPSSGTVEVDDGTGFAPAAPAILNQRVGYLFQDPDRQIFAPTVGDELAAAVRAAGPGRGTLALRVEEAIDRFALPPAATPSALTSYGSRKRLQAAAGWILARELVILDEADSGLSYRAFLGLLETLRDTGAGIVVVTHDAALARAAADRVVALADGRIAADTRDGGCGIETALAAGGLGAAGAGA